jgi:hypothetical protein
MLALDATVFPSLGALARGEASSLLTMDEQADFLSAAQTASTLPESAARQQLLRCLDKGAESLARRRELAREIVRLEGRS